MVSSPPVTGSILRTPWWLCAMRLRITFWKAASFLKTSGHWSWSRFNAASGIYKRRIAITTSPQCSQQIVIAAMPDSGFAEHRTSQLAQVALAPLNPDDSLVNEWNLVIVAPGYTSMVLCHELSEDEYRADNLPKTDAERKFYGLWTFDRFLVERRRRKILIERMRPYDETLANRLLHLQQLARDNPNRTPIDLSGVVSRIVSYLQTSQEELITTNRQTREFWELEGQALRLNRNLKANKLQAFLRMAQQVDERDAANPSASVQVAALAETLGQMLDLPTLKLRRLRLAGLLFRVGLAKAPATVFTQLASDLEDSTSRVWRDRMILGAQLLEPCRS